MEGLTRPRPLPYSTPKSINGRKTAGFFSRFGAAHLRHGVGAEGRRELVDHGSQQLLALIAEELGYAGRQRVSQAGRAARRAARPEAGGSTLARTHMAAACGPRTVFFRSPLALLDRRLPQVWAALAADWRQRLAGVKRAVARLLVRVPRLRVGRPRTTSGCAARPRPPRRRTAPP